MVFIPPTGNKEERLQRYLQEVCKRLQAELPDSAFGMSEIYEKIGAKIRLFSSRNVKKIWVVNDSTPLLIVHYRKEKGRKSLRKLPKF